MITLLPALLSAPHRCTALYKTRPLCTFLFYGLDWKPPKSPLEFRERVDHIDSITTVAFYDLPPCVIVVYFIRKVRWLL